LAVAPPPPSYRIRDISANSQYRQRDNSQNRNRGGSYDRSRDQNRNRDNSNGNQRRQPLRDGSFNRSGYNPANGPRDRLRDNNNRPRTPSSDRSGYRPNQRTRSQERPDQRTRDRPRTPSGDRTGYRPSVRPDRRQNDDYQNSYKKPNYNPSREIVPYRPPNTETEDERELRRRREGSLEAKKLSQAGARMANPSSNSRDRSRTPERRDFSRDRSFESKGTLVQDEKVSKAYPNMKKGVNCSANYNPVINKSCSKCPQPQGHHEFLCNKYNRYNYNRCSSCNLYNHYPSECKEVPKYPPKLIDANSIYIYETNPN